MSVGKRRLVTHGFSLRQYHMWFPVGFFVNFIFLPTGAEKRMFVMDNDTNNNSSCIEDTPILIDAMLPPAKIGVDVEKLFKIGNISIGTTEFYCILPELMSKLHREIHCVEQQPRSLRNFALLRSLKDDLQVLELYANSPSSI